MKNIIIVLLVVLVAVEGVFLLKQKPKPAVEGAMTAVSPTPRPSGAPAGRPPLLTRGMKLTGSPMEKFAFKIAPGAIPDASQKMLTGFTVTSKTLTDGSIQVDLVPKDTDDQFQSYTLKKGNSLYFIEMTQTDDVPDSDRDQNYRDDYGIIVDGAGVVQ